MYDPDEHNTLRALIETLGKDECLRLGFVIKTDNETLHVSAVGMGFLLDVRAADVETLHEAYAAGFQQGKKQAKDGF